MIMGIIYGVYGLLTVLGLIIAFRLFVVFQLFNTSALVSAPESFAELPSVTVCIPARDETHAMTESLERVIASRYHKLEIIVLDDGSGDNTSVLIKSFAHAGVRFVEGSPLPSGWLGKNHALQGLLNEASGTFILYMDVDTRIEPETIGRLVSYVLQENADMVSVLPRRHDDWRSSVIFSPLRYFWEVLFHRPSSPASASSAWMIRRQSLIDQNGFGRLKSVIQPESELAAMFSADSRYRLLIGTRQLGVSYEKKWRSQLSTSMRLLYPILGYKLVSIILAAVGLIVVVSPVLVGTAAIIKGHESLVLLSFSLYLFYAIILSTYLRRVWNRGWWLAALLWPVLIVQEILLLLLSAVRYETNRITWKSRPVTTDLTARPH